MREPRASDPIPPRPDVGSGHVAGGDGLGSWRRLHPAAIAVWISGLAGGFLLPILVLLILGGDRSPVLFATIFGAVAVVGSAVRWTRFWYRVDGRTLVVRGGLLQRWERTLPPARIQSVDVVQKLTHRVFGVVELRVEVVGGQGTEAALVALPPDEAASLRALLMADHGEEERARAAPTPPLVRMRPTELILAGLTGGRVAVLAALIGSVLQLLPGDTFVRTFDRIAGGDRSSLETVAIVAGALLLLSILVSLISTVFVYWNFRAVRQGDRLVITRGLLQSRRSVVPIARIQAVRIEENLLRRIFGLASLRVLTAGYGRGSGDEQQSSTLVPVAAQARCAAVGAAVLGSDRLPEVRLQPAPGRALALRLCAAGVVAVGALALVLVLAEGDFAVAAIPVPPIAAAVAYLSWRALGHAIADPHVVVRWGGLVRRTAFAPGANVQHVVLRRTPLQRAFGLASVTLAIPKATTAVTDLAVDVAEDRFEELSERLLG
ncbi:MAG TPA: PH domain-containing protein [Actinomycetota bacterium]|nr:PH domain-containing protein [Actinomycetota bacterium]